MSREKNDADIVLKIRCLPVAKEWRDKMSRELNDIDLLLKAR